MAWLELHQSVRDHRKIVELADTLDMPEPHVVGHLTYLWLWAIDNAPDGVLPTSARVIARAAWWTGDPDHFLAALIDAGLVDRDGDGLLIHDWEIYTGKLIGQRKANAERQKRHRDRGKRDEMSTSQVPVEQPDTSVTVTSPLRNGATEQNSTEPNSTVPGDTPLDPPGADAPTTDEAKTKRQRRKPEVPIPADFTLTPERLEAGLTEGLPEDIVRHEFRKLHAHAIATDRRQVDWDASWQTWVLKAVDEYRPRLRSLPTTPARASPASSREDAERRLQEMRARRAQETVP